MTRPTTSLDLVVLYEARGVRRRKRTPIEATFRTNETVVVRVLDDAPTCVVEVEAGNGHRQSLEGVVADGVAWFPLDLAFEGGKVFDISAKCLGRPDTSDPTKALDDDLAVVEWSRRDEAVAEAHEAAIGLAMRDGRVYSRHHVPILTIDGYPALRLEDTRLWAFVPSYESASRFDLADIASMRETSSGSFLSILSVRNDMPDTTTRFPGHQRSMVAALDAAISSGDHGPSGRLVAEAAVLRRDLVRDPFGADVGERFAVLAERISAELSELDEEWPHEKRGKIVSRLVRTAWRAAQAGLVPPEAMRGIVDTSMGHRHLGRAVDEVIEWCAKSGGTPTIS